MQNCPHCSKAIFKMSEDGSRLKAPTTMLIMHKSGGIEINCGHCKQGVILPLQAIQGDVTLKKARGRTRFFVPKDA